MKEDKLIEIITVQSEIIEILSREYTDAPRSPYEKNEMRDLIRLLKELQKDLTSDQLYDADIPANRCSSSETGRFGLFFLLQTFSFSYCSSRRQL